MVEINRIVAAAMTQKVNQEQLRGMTFPFDVPDSLPRGYSGPDVGKTNRVAERLQKAEGLKKPPIK